MDIFYGLSGSATPGFDYAPLSGVVTIPAGQTNAVIELNPLNDFDTELVETAVLTLAPGIGYVIDTDISALATINDDDAAHAYAACPDRRAKRAQRRSTHTASAPRKALAPRNASACSHGAWLRPSSAAAAHTPITA